MFSYQINFLRFQISLVSFLLILLILFSAFISQAIICYTLKIKYSQINSSYKANGAKMAQEFLRLKNKPHAILITSYKIFNFKKHNVILNKKIAFDSSIWAQTIAIFNSQKHLHENKAVFYYQKSISWLQIIACVFLFIEINELKYSGLTILATTFSLTLILNISSIKIIKIINNTISPFMNQNDLKNMLMILKYFKLFYTYQYFMAMPFLFYDLFYFLKRNGIGRV